MSKQLNALTHRTVQEVIRLAEERRKFADAEAVKNPTESTLGRDLMAQMAKGPDKTSLALLDKVESLTDDQKNELLALMWLGRGAAGETVDMWSDLIDAARQEDVEGKVGTLMGKSPLGSYLSKGLERLGE